MIASTARRAHPLLRTILRDEIDKNGKKIKIEEYEVKNIKEKRYIAEFEYKDVQYQLKGIMEKDEFDKIIKNLFFM